MYAGEKADKQQTMDSKGHVERRSDSAKMNMRVALCVYESTCWVFSIPRETWSIDTARREKLAGRPLGDTIVSRPRVSAKLLPRHKGHAR